MPDEKVATVTTVIAIKRFPIRLNHDEPLEEKISRVLPSVDSRINSLNFPHCLSGKREGEATAVSFREVVDNREAEKLLEEMDLRPGTPSELADFYETNRKSECLPFPLVALGAEWKSPWKNGRSFVVVLEKNTMALRPVGDWPPGTWFLAF